MACLIAAPTSGSGKTLLSLALAALARRRGQSIQTFKVGPDFLDPQLLARVSGRSCRNLDPLLCGEAWVHRCFEGYGSQAELALVEGVMGLFDGRGPSSAGSSAAVAVQLQLPVVLVVEASRQAGSVAALVRGFRDHDPAVAMAGVVLNGVSTPRHQALLAEALASIAVPLLGVLPRHESLCLPSRHLGLLPAHELLDLDERLEGWAALAEQHLDLERLWPLLEAPPPPAAGTVDPIRWCLQPGRHDLESQAASATDPAPEAPHGRAPVPVAMASDGAFHFRYPEALELLEAVGLQVRLWSPLADEPLPSGTQALILPGGYPELHAAELAACRRSLGALRAAAAAGLPIYAECGGLLLLGSHLEDPVGAGHAMAGVLPFRARRGPLDLGYREASARGDGLLVRRGERLRGHEFHRWELRDAGGAPLAAPGGQAGAGETALKPLWELEGWGSPRRLEGWGTPRLHASWLHLHWAGCPALPARLAAAARAQQSMPSSGRRWARL
ncbi:cobyrinate a,c-diamide synthase [Cyanobium sp. Morenito 9A2]|uniref:cobyrinate a,c-diamide synthase n=1 Tax=Cyanobium sp. Morenito 9A2 TaxID=2823718 RepID=UPI0020CF64A8|nr:cobyrinate a,c-diamide synthase [Cyanobium sp. Morenito 9A2]MCP9848372.1 cobyrinate a,c-diamide synthase [Cyanobium sp. Morenito 9A2]